MTYSFRKILCAGLAPLALLGLGMLPAHAQSEAQAAYDAYNAGFLVQQNGQTFYANTLNTLGSTSAGEWSEALDIDVVEDRYQYTHAQADRNMMIAIVNTLAYNNGPNSSSGNWQTDGWDDNLAWMINSFLRGYLATGVSNYLTEAEAGWNAGYKQGWDTTVAGGGIWENTGKGSKCGLSNSPFVFEGVQLYQVTGDASYLTKAEAIYAWERTALFNASSTSNALGAPGQVDGCVGTNGKLQSLSNNVYDSGLFIEAADSLYRITGNAMYSNDAALAINYVIGNGSIIQYQNSGERQHQWEYWFTRGLSDYATETNQWSKYQTYLQNNAQAAWNERNMANLTWNQWNTPTNDSNPDGMEMTSAAAIWQHLPPPAMNLSGTFEIKSVASGLALNVTGGSTANGAAIIQWPFSAGQTNALWTFVPTSGGYYQIKNVNSGEVVNVTGASGINGAAVIQWSAQGMIPGNDQWMPVSNGDGTYSFYNLYSQQALDVPGGSTASKVQMDQWFGNSTAAQKWTLVAQ